MLRAGKKKATVESTVVTTVESTKEYIYSTVDALDAVIALLPGLPGFFLLFFYFYFLFSFKRNNTVFVILFFILSTS